VIFNIVVNILLICRHFPRRVLRGCSGRMQRIPCWSAAEQTVQLDSFRAVLQAGYVTTARFDYCWVLTTAEQRLIKTANRQKYC